MFAVIKEKSTKERLFKSLFKILETKNEADFPVIF